MSFFRLEFEKIIAIFVIRTVNIYQNRNNLAKRKKEFEKKNVLFLVFFGMKFEKAIVMFEIRTPKFLYTQSFIQKERTVNLGPKTLIWVFGAKFEKIIVILEISIFDFAKNEF